METKLFSLVQIFKRKESLLFLVLFIAVFSLFGWLFGMITFTTFSEKYIPIAPSTAVIFIALCLLFLSHLYFRKSLFIQTVEALITIFVVLFCIEIVLDYFFNFSWDIENIFISDPASLGNVLTGRISPITSLLFISTCAGIWGIRQNNSDIIRHIGGRFSLVVFLLSSVLLIGYLYKAPLLYGGQIIPVAMPTAICFFLFSITLLRACELQFWTFNSIKDHPIISQLLKWFLPIVIFIVVLQGLLITDYSLDDTNPVLTAAIILLVVIFITIIAVMRVSVIIGKNIRKVEDKLTASETRYRRLFETAKDGILILDAETGMIIDVNPFLIEMLGYSKEQFLTKAIWEIGFFKDIAANRDRFSELRHKEYIRYDDLPLETADGHMKNVEFVSNVYLVNAHKVLQCNIRDISDRIQAEESRKLEKVRLQAQLDLHRMMDAPPDQLLDFTLEAITKSIKSQFSFIGTMDDNEAVMTIHKWSKDAMLQCAVNSKPIHFSISGSGLWGECVRQRKPVIINKYADAPNKKGTPVGHVTIERFMAVPVFDGGKIVAVAAVANKSSDYDETDVAALLNLTNRLWGIIRRKHTEEEIKQKNEQLQLINTQKDKFFSIIAHDLKSPFNSIMGFSEELVEQIGNKNYAGTEKYAGIILQSSERAMDLLANLMEWSRSQIGRIEFNPEYFELVSLVNDTIALLDFTARQKSIRITKDLPPFAPVYADKGMISTVLRNLISNAIKFTQPSGMITILISESHHELTVAVTDSGIGIPKESIDKLFRLDESYSTPGTQNEKGTGLGLILCKEFIDKHGGKIWVDSEAGKGSTFSFTINTPDSPAQIQK